MDLQHVRGHRLYGNEGIWFFESTGDVYDPANEPNCIACGLSCTDEGPDPCIGWIDDDRIAGICCGHGDPEEEYVSLKDGTRWSSILDWNKSYDSL